MAGKAICVCKERKVSGVVLEFGVLVQALTDGATYLLGHLHHVANPRDRDDYDGHAWIASHFRLHIFSTAATLIHEQPQRAEHDAQTSIKALRSHDRRGSPS